MFFMKVRILDFAPLHRSQLLNWSPPGESIRYTVPVPYVFLTHLPAKVDLFSIGPNMRKIDQAIIPSFNKNPLLVKVFGNFHKPHELRGEKTLPIRAASAEILVAINIVPPLV